MLEIYQRRIPRYPVISLEEERVLIAKSQEGCKKSTEEIVLRHIGFIVFRIYKKAFPSYIFRFGEDIVSKAIFILYDKIQTYDLNYKNKHGDPQPVRFKSYIWKRIDGFILDSLKLEIESDRRGFMPDWERYAAENSDVHP